MIEHGPSLLPTAQASKSLPGEYVADGLRGPSSRYQTLPGLLNVLRQRWKVIVYTALAIFALGSIACFLIQSYSATTIIEINKADPTDNDGAQSNGPALSSDDIKDEVATDVSILQTDDSLALTVINKLNLLSEPSFKKAVVDSERNKPLSEAPKTRDRVLKIFRGRLKVETPPDTRLITLTFKASDPVLASNVTNTLADTFIDDTLSRRALAIQRSSNWLQSQLEMLKIRVEKSEQALADYEKQTGLAGIELTGSSSANGVSSVSVTPENTVTSRLLALNQELTAAESNRIATEAVYHLVQSQDPEIVLGLGPMSVSSAAGGGAGSISPDAIALVNSLRAQETDLSRQLAASSVKYGTSNPRYVELQEQVDTINKQLQTELNRVRQRAANNLAYAKRNEETIRSQFESQEKAANSMADKSVRLQILAQEAFSNRALYEGLFSKLQTSNLASGTRATRISIVDRAFAPGTPNFPKWGLALVAIFAVSIFLGVSGAFLSESLDQTIRGPEDLDEIGGVSMLGYVPRLALENALESRSIATQLISHPRSPFSEAFRSLRTALKIGTLPVHGKVFLVTSALGGDGKTTIAYNLALAFAQQSAKVLLIDADLRNPDLHNLFGAAITPGLSDLCKESFFNGVPVGIVQHPTLPRLFLLPAGTPSNFPSELIESNSFTDALAKLAMVYDYIVIDSPPILAVTDASIIATKVDSVVAVVRSRRTTRSVLDGLVQAIYRTQVPSFNFVLNDVRHPTLDGFQTYSYSREKEPKLAAGI